MDEEREGIRRPAREFAGPRPAQGQGQQNPARPNNQGLGAPRAQQPAPEPVPPVPPVSPQATGTPPQSSSVARLVGTLLTLIGIFMGCALLVVMLMPRGWTRVNGQVVDVENGVLAKVKYIANGTQYAYLRIPRGVAKGDIVEISYLTHAPGEAVMSHVRASTLLVYSIPALAMVTLLGLALILFG